MENLQRFFRAPTPGSCAKENDLAGFASIHELGRAWAEAGSQILLTKADVPSVSNIQACEVLCMYWFAIGDLDRCTMYFSEYNPCSVASIVKLRKHYKNIWLMSVITRYITRVMQNFAAKS